MFKPVFVLMALLFPFCVAEASSNAHVRVQTPSGIKPVDISFPDRGSALEICQLYSIPMPKITDLTPEKTILSESDMDTLFSTASTKIVIRAIRMISELLKLNGVTLDMSALTPIRYSVEPAELLRAQGGGFFFAEDCRHCPTSETEAAIAQKLDILVDQIQASQNPRFVPQRFGRISASRVELTFVTSQGEIYVPLIVYLEDDYTLFVADQRGPNAETFDTRIFGIGQTVHVRGYLNLATTDAKTDQIRKLIPSGISTDIRDVYRFAVDSKPVDSSLPKLFKEVLNIALPRQSSLMTVDKTNDDLSRFIKLTKTFFEFPENKHWFR